MAGLLQSTLDGLRREIDRFRNRPMLNATMAATALVAIADGVVSFSEQNRVDVVLQNLKALSVFEVHEAIDLFNDHVEAIRSNPEEGREQAMKAVIRLADQPTEARLLVRVCLAISHADGNVSAQEQQAIEEICQSLGIDPQSVEL